MKTLITMKKRILSILAIGLVVANVNAATVKDNNKGDKNTTTTEKERSDVGVKYIGESTDNGVVFDVNYSNPTGERFVLVISNNQGDVLYNQSFKGADFRKTVMIKKDSDATGAVKFTVRSSNSEVFSKSFSIDTEARVVRTVVVKSIN